MPEISGPIATILVGLLSALLVLYIRRKNAAVAAASKFRGVLLSDFAGLYPIPANWPSNIDARLRQIFPSLQHAVEEFRPYVPFHVRRSYDRAWFVYRLGSDGREIDKQLYHQYMGFTSPGEPTIDPTQTFRSNVARLLAFAGET